MPSLSRRKLIKLGENGLVVTIPKDWSDYYHLVAGDKVEVIANTKLVIKPIKINTEE